MHTREEGRRGRGGQTERGCVAKVGQLWSDLEVDKNVSLILVPFTIYCVVILQLRL